MNPISLSPDTIKSLLWLVAMLVADYLCVIIAVLIDLRSGTMKARRLGIPRTSSGYRRTIDKMMRYVITLLALTAVDAMIVTGAMLLHSTMAWHVPAFPALTTIGAIGIGLIEAKSVVENSQQKQQARDTLRYINRLMADDEVRKLLDTLLNKLNKS